tara:strand:+ start:240 stop:548 length:309 start_codon:yes stop_codon:yes gene_type:complete
MSIEKLQQDILICKQAINEIPIKHHDTASYTDLINNIFTEIFKDYLEESGKIKGIKNQCPDKLEPAERDHIVETLEAHSYLPETSLKKLRETLGLKDDVEIN